METDLNNLALTRILDALEAVDEVRATLPRFGGGDLALSLAAARRHLARSVELLDRRLADEPVTVAAE